MILVFRLVEFENLKRLHLQMEEVHYIDDGFPFAVTESFMDLFEGLTYAQADAAAFAGALQEQVGCTSVPFLFLLRIFFFSRSSPELNSIFNLHCSKF